MMSIAVVSRYFSATAGNTDMKLATLAAPFLATLMFVGATATPSAAEETTALWEWSSPSAVETDPWRFNVNLYGWLPDAPVDISTPEGRSASLPEDFDTILEALEFAAMAEGEVHKGPFGVFASPLYYKGSIDEHFIGPLGESRTVTLDEKAFFMKYGASYDLGKLRLGSNADSPTVTIQPYAGALFLHDKIRTKLRPGSIGPGLTVRTTLEFNTPVVGVNTLWDLSDRWSLRLGGNYGGWGVDDVDKTYEAVGTLAYHFDMWDQDARVFAGYRYLHIEFDSGSVQVDLDVKGPLIGIGFDF